MAAPIPAPLYGSQQSFTLSYEPFFPRRIADETTSSLNHDAMVQHQGISDILEACLKGHNVTAVYPHHGEAYVELSQPYNQRLYALPVAIVAPVDESDISNAINCAQTLGVPVSARSGGHSYGAHGLTGLVLDMSRHFNFFRYDEATQTVEAGPGIRLGDFALLLARHGRAAPHGTCPTVALGGHASHGGYGFYSRVWGMAMDRVLSHRVVLANGSVTTASIQTNPDLFFALKGAAPSFGIITAFNLTTERMPSIDNNVRIDYAWELSADEAAQAFLRWQASLPSLPAELGMAFHISATATEKKLRVKFMGQFLGTLDGLAHALGDQIELIGRPLVNQTGPIEWLAMLEWMAESGLESKQLLHIRDTFYAKSMTIRESDPMSVTQVRALMEHLSSGFKNFDWFAMADNWGGVASVINRVPVEATALDRTNLFGWQFYARTNDWKPPFPHNAYTFVQGMFDAVIEKAPVGWDYGGYANYIDTEITRDEAHRRYYGTHVDRLQTIKKRSDPSNVFSSFPQAFRADD